MKHIILGNGPAGVVAAETLRRAAPGDDILMVGNEAEPPYSRMAIPYLLEGNIDESGTYLRKSADHFDSLGIRQYRGRAVALNTDKRTVLFDDGHFEDYDRLLIATGSHPVRPPIPGIDLPEVQTCWTLDDARAIARLAKPGSRVLQLGAGFIGCIIMEALAKRGVQLTVVEVGDRMVPRMMTPEAGGMIKRWVEKQGVRVLTGAGVEFISKGSAAPLTVKLSTGESLDCDLLIAAAGVAPNVSFLDGTSVHVAKGVLVDDSMQTSVPGIYAAGDVAEAPDLFSGRHLIAAIQPNAADQARVAALNMAGQAARMKGVLAINVLDSMGMISSSFGEWQGVAGGDGIEQADEANGRYISLQFNGDVLVGATSVGLTEHVGALRGLIQGKMKLGTWKQKLLETPTRFAEAYIACQRPNS
ncbi:FAD-dependent oxidoreductase [Dechloromonas sp. XY25]|uniref:FAD-dependent oxidoreductase n=1 Tax=Dechloromonas hankyongensis TaxID=2908002 RepID=A0ABS9K2I4_9RHOO|nr:FAD-dependent oxidoreductase [Dechloromonas hankyongensis]MCG2577392.1 FAD-dependent oxidoreductase [Dechloromonas hankyongensis]